MAGKQKTPFSWKKHTANLQKKFEYRVARLAVTNLDFQVKHPDICRDLTKGMHKSCELFCKQEIEKRLKKSMVPVPVRPERLNRIV